MSQRNDKISKAFCVNLLLSLAIILGAVSVIYYVLQIKYLFYISFVGMLFNLFCFFIARKSTYSFIQPLIYLYIITISLDLFLHSYIWLYNDKSSSIFFWYFCIPLGLYVVFPYRKMVIYSVSILLSTCIALIFINAYELFPSLMPKLSHENKIIIDAATLLGAFYLILFIIYYIRLKQQEGEVKKEVLVSKTQTKYSKTDSKIEALKFKNLYQSIIFYLEEEEPWRNSNFNILELAMALNSNVSYISKSINQESEHNFNSLINTYRINFIKKEINKSENAQFTLMHIYTNAGFKHQSTFNKAFKQVEGITPTEYMNQIRGNNKFSLS